MTTSKHTPNPGYIVDRSPKHSIQVLKFSNKFKAEEAHPYYYSAASPYHLTTNTELRQIVYAAVREGKSVLVCTVSDEELDALRKDMKAYEDNTSNRDSDRAETPDISETDKLPIITLD